MAHVSPDAVFEAIDWRIVKAKINGAPHSIWEILNHLIYWQHYCLELIEGGNPTSPKHAVESWACSEAPLNEKHWADTVNEFLTGLKVAEEAVNTDLDGNLVARPEESRIEVFESLIGHNSYHLGQIVLLRQFLGSWPPPSGGNTW
jgi:uncharacterized damage-inducible protein DinB